MKASLSCCRSSGPGEDYISIEVRDASSRTVALRLELSFENFGRLLANIGGVEAEAEWDTARIGLKREHKTELVPWSREVTAEAAIKPFETDGWLASYDDYKNSHKINYKTNQVSVLFVRWVKP